jgi:hypothetical protein
MPPTQSRQELNYITPCVRSRFGSLSPLAVLPAERSRDSSTNSNRRSRCRRSAIYTVRMGSSFSQKERDIIAVNSAFTLTRATAKGQSRRRRSFSRVAPSEESRQQIGEDMRSCSRESHGAFHQRNDSCQTAGHRASKGDTFAPSRPRGNRAINSSGARNRNVYPRFSSMRQQFA